ncbi:hypothetical protein GH733_003982 [Mirounga leonina]|nr:hypothetical protein GH733_003982 [Mirounga leonina]
MTFQVWGWRREDASPVLAWVPDAEGGRGAAMPRRTPGEPSAGVLGRPEPFGQPCCGEEGRQRGGSRPGRDAGTGRWPCWGCDPQDTSASPGGARPACKRSWGEEAAGPQHGPASEQLQMRPLSACRIASRLVLLFRTPLGRARAWLRLALMQKKMADYLRCLIIQRDLLSEFYEYHALMMEEEGAVIVGLLVGLNVIDANLCVKGEDLDSQVSESDLNVQIAAILDQKNYVEELNRQLNSTVSSLHSRVDSLEKSNTKLIEELAIAKNNIIKLQEENHQLRSENKLILMKTQQHLEVTKVDVETELQTYKHSRQGLDEMYNEARRQLRDESQLRQGSEDGLKEKNEIIVRLEEKTNKITAAMRQLEQRLQQAEKAQMEAEDEDKKYLQECQSKSDNLQKQISQKEKQLVQLETDLKIEKEWRQTLQEDLQKEKDALSHLRNETQQIISLKKEFLNIQDENQQLKKIYHEQEQALEELGNKLSE